MFSYIFMVLKYLHSNVIRKKVNDTENQEYDTFYETIWSKKFFLKKWMSWNKQRY